MTDARKIQIYSTLRVYSVKLDWDLNLCISHGMRVVRRDLKEGVRK